jgi:hypothetical protein
MAGPALPSREDADEFVGKIEEVSRLIDGLSRGTITPDYVDAKMDREASKSTPKVVTLEARPADVQSLGILLSTCASRVAVACRLARQLSCCWQQDGVHACE